MNVSDSPGFTFNDFLTRKGLPLSTTSLQTLVSEQLMEELGIGGFFSATACNRASYTSTLASGFEIGREIGVITNMEQHFGGGGGGGGFDG